MASRGLGSLTLDLIAKIGGFTGPLDQASRNADKNFKKMGDSAERFGQGLGRSLKALGGQLLAFAGLTASVSAAVGSIKSAIDRADSLRDFAIRLDLSAEAASKFSYAATQTGTSVEALSKSLIILSKNAAAALNPKSKQAGLFKALLGPDYEKDLGNLETLVPKVSDALNKLEDSTAKTGIQLALMGRNGAELKEFMALGSEGFKALADRASELGIVLSQETLDAADQFNDKLADLKAATGGLATEVAASLLPQLTEMVDWAIDFVTDGDKVAELTTDLRQGFSDFGDALSTASEAGGIFLTFAARSRGALQDMQSDFQEATVRIAEFFAVYEYQIQGAQRLRDNITKDFGNVQGSPTELAKVTVTGNLKEFARQEAEKRKEAKKTQDEINKYLATGGKTGSGSKKKGGKSDAEKEAEQLLKSYQSMEASYREQIALVGDVTEVEKLRYELTNGEGKKFNEEQKATLLALAAQKDAVEAANKQLQEGKSLTESLLAPFEAINAEREKALKLLNAGAISQETYNRALEASITPAEQMREDLAFETELLGKTIEQQELLTAARLLGAEAATTQGQAAIEALKKYQEESKAMAEQVELMDGVRDSFGDFFTSIIDGSKSAKDAFKDLVTDILAQITKLMVNKAIEQMFGAYGSNSGGAAGGGWGAALASLFGGPKASGGPVNPGMFYRVNENGPEILSVAGKDYLMMGNQGGMVTSNNRTGNGAAITQQFITAGLESRRTSERKAQLAGRAAQRAMARNGR